MSEINYEKFLSDLVKPLVVHPEEVVVSTFSEDENAITLQIMVHPDDLGRVIGKRGRVANSIRTIVFACASRFGKRIEVSIDSF